jgi:hypothetical protein
VPARKNRPDKYNQHTAALALDEVRTKNWRYFDQARKFIFSEGWQEDQEIGRWYKPISSLSAEVAQELLHTAAPQYRVAVDENRMLGGVPTTTISVDAEAYHSRIKPLFPKLGR